jgi:predicted aspartyl protease
MLGAMVEQPAEHQRPVEGVILPLESVRGRLVAVPGSIAHLERLRLLVDTGTYRTIIADRIARALQLRGLDAELSAFGQSRRAEDIVLPNVHVGHIRRQNFPVLAADLSSLAARLGWQPDAILGLDMLRGHCLTLDYRARQLIFACQTGWSTSVPLETNSPYPVVPVRIDDHDHRLLVDTGSDVLALYKHAAGKHADRLERGSFTADTFAGTVELGRFTASRIWIGLTLLERQTVYVVTERDPRLGHDGVLGPANLAPRIQLDLRAMVISW